MLRVVFQNFRMVTKCEILSTRQASSNLPLGFGVRFTDLSEASKMIIDQIVNDAIVHALVEPDSEASVPSLAEDSMLTPNFELG